MLNILTIEGQARDTRASQRLYELREEASRVLVIVRNLPLRPTAGVNRVERHPDLLHVRRNETRRVDLAEADIRHALQDQLQKAAVAELDVIECPSIQRLENVAENFTRHGRHCGSSWL